MLNENKWIATIEKKIRDFATHHGSTYSQSERVISAAFEIGCFHSLVEFYAERCQVMPENLIDGKFRYLTSPNGNPKNFSCIKIIHRNSEYQLRQQVRIVSAINPDIAFTPDMCVFRRSRSIKSHYDKDYAKGNRSFFFINAKDMIAIHECKCMNPFPELLVSFLGMVYASFEWATAKGYGGMVDKSSLHLAPSLFVGGSARGLHIKMISAIKTSFPVNIIAGMHYGTWDLTKADAELNKVRERRRRAKDGGG